MIDWNKPIEYVDGSPAKYLGAIGRYQEVTPRNRPDGTTGNYYDADGTHAYGFYPNVRNVDTGLTDKELADKIRKIDAEHLGLIKELLSRGYNMELTHGTVLHYEFHRMQSIKRIYKNEVVTKEL